MSIEALPGCDQASKIASPSANSFGFRSALRNSSALSLPQVAARILSLALIPVYTRCLSPADFGILELLDLTLYFFTALCGAQLSSAILFFHAKGRAIDEEEVFNAGLLWGTSIGIVFAALGCLLASRLSAVVFGSQQFTSPLRFYFAAFSTGPLFEAALVILRVKNRIGLFNLAIISRNVFQAGVNVALLWLARLGYMSFVWSSLATSLLFGAIAVVCFYTRYRFVVNRATIFGTARYSMPLGVGAIMMLMVHYGDRFFLQRFVSLSEVGIYSLSYKIGMLAYAVYGPFSIYWSVERFRISSGDLGDHFYTRIFTYLALIMGATLLILSAISGPALFYMVPKEYQRAAPLIPWIALAYVLRALGEHLRGALMVTGQTITDTKISVTGGLLCLACYALLIPRYGASGAVAATLVAFAFMAVPSFVTAQRVKRYRFEAKRLAQIVFSVCLSVGPALALRNSSIGVRTAAAAISILAFPVVVWSIGFFEPSEKAYLSAVWALRPWRSRFGGDNAGEMHELGSSRERIR